MKEIKPKKEMPNIDIYKAWCKGCGICAAFCPTGALARDESGFPYVKDVAKCIGCGWCEMRCPDFAITVRQKDGSGKKKREEGEKENPQREAAPGE